MSCIHLNDLPAPPIGRTGWPWTVGTKRRAEIADGLIWPKISIVMPSYNHGRFIEEAIRSVILQCYPNLEFIIMDGGSEDETLEIIKKYEPWISSWVSARDSGQVDALNRAFPQTTGEILNWLNSDDLLLPEALFTVAALFGLDSGVDIVAGARLQRSVATEIEQLWVPWLDKWPMILMGFPYFPQEATYFSRRIWKTIGSFDENLDYAFDGAFFSRAVEHAERIVLTETPIGVMHAYPEQKSLRTDKTMRINRARLRDLVLSNLSLFHRLVVRLCFTRFWIIGEAILRCLMYRRAKQKFWIGAYEWSEDKWLIRPF